MGTDPFRDDLLASSGLDDRSSSNGYLKRAEAPDPADPSLETVRVLAE